MLPSLPGLPFALPREGGCVSDLPWRGAGKVTVGRSWRAEGALFGIPIPSRPAPPVSQEWMGVRAGGRRLWPRGPAV